jgi:hypothetical protein
VSVTVAIGVAVTVTVNVGFNNCCDIDFIIHRNWFFINQTNISVGNILYRDTRYKGCRKKA